MRKKGISIALIIHSLGGSLSHSLFIRLIGFGENPFVKGEQNVNAARVFRAVGVTLSLVFCQKRLRKIGTKREQKADFGGRVHADRVRPIQ